MKRLFTGLMAASMAVTSLVGCSTSNAASETAAAAVETKAAVETSVAEEGTAPKYVILFIGDGMSYPQIQSTSDYLGALNDEDYFMAQPSLEDNEGAILDGPEYLNFMNFVTAGSAVT